MKARIKWLENVAFVGESESGHAVVMDGAPEGGGRNVGARPMEMVLIGTGGCTAYDVVHILRKSRAPITDCVVEIDADRAAEDKEHDLALLRIYGARGLKPLDLAHAGLLRRGLPTGLPWGVLPVAGETSTGDGT